jgi:hypothetical protein
MLFHNPASLFLWVKPFIIVVYPINRLPSSTLEQTCIVEKNSNQMSSFGICLFSEYGYICNQEKVVSIGSWGTFFP